jgi:HEAT repeat protein
MGATNASPALVHVAEVAALLKDANPAVRACAADTLGQMGTAGKDHANDLAACLDKEKESDMLVRAAAVQALAHIGPAGLQSISVVMEALGDADPRTRHLAEITFRAMGGMLTCEKGSAKDSLSSVDPKTREAAAVAIGNVAQLHTHRMAEGHLGFPEHQGAHIQRQHALQADQGPWKLWCQTVPHQIHMYGPLGPRQSGHDFIPPLVALLNDDDAAVREAAIGALAQVADVAPGYIVKDIADATAVWLTPGCNIVAQQAAAALAGRLESRGGCWSHLLVPLLRSPDPTSRKVAATALGQMGSNAISTAADIAVLLRDADKFTRAAAVEALGKLGCADSPEVERLLQDAWPEVREAAQKALGCE